MGLIRYRPDCCKMMLQGLCSSDQTAVQDLLPVREEVVSSDRAGVNRQTKPTWMANSMQLRSRRHWPTSADWASVRGVSGIVLPREKKRSSWAAYPDHENTRQFGA